MFNNSGCCGGGGYSLADVAAAVGNRNGNNNGDGFNNGWWILIILFAIFGENGFGFGNRGGYGAGNGGGGGVNYVPYAAAESALTRGELCQDMNFQELSSATRGIQQGLCDGFYAMNTGMMDGFAGVQSALCQGFSGVTAQGVANTNAIQNSINDININNMQTANSQAIMAMQNANALERQIADCCCENRAGQLALQNQMITDTCAVTNAINTSTRDIIDNNNAGVRSILDYLCQEKISDLQSENQMYKFAASQQEQNNYLISQLRPPVVPAYTVPNPYAATGCCCNFSC